MPDPPRVSVITIFLDAEHYLQEAIESVLAQTYEAWELLLVDDGSTDHSAEIARRYALLFPGKIRYLQHPGHQNLGMSAARNLGILNAKGEYLAFLDADDYWLPERLEAHVGILDSHPEAGMLYGSIRYWHSWTGLPQDSRRDYVPLLRVRDQSLFHPPSLLLLFLEQKVEVPCPSSILVRANVARELGGFEVSFRQLYEDQAFYAKVCLYTSVLATSDCLAWYRQHPDSSTWNAISSMQGPILRREFLTWLARYCREKHVQDARVLQAVRRQMWLNNAPFHPSFSAVSWRIMRWIRKWILRLEERMLPWTVRQWLWTRDQK